MESLDKFNTIKKRPLAEEIASQILRMLEEGRYLPGDKLPPERALALKLNVSRPIIREALKSLDEDGFIYIQHGSGVYVSDQLANIFFAPLEKWLSKNKNLVQEFYQARLAFEPECAALASINGTDEQFLYLRQLVEDSYKAMEENNLLLFVGMDIDFHYAIAEVSGNRFFTKMLDSIINRETDLRKIILRLPGHFPRTIQGHLKLVEAIASRDPETARQAMFNSINEALIETNRFMASIGKNDYEETGPPANLPKC